MTAASTVDGRASKGDRVGHLGASNLTDVHSVSPPKSPIKLGALGLIAFFCVAVFTGLGVWHLERRAWKLDLIDQVEERVHALVEPVLL